MLFIYFSFEWAFSPLVRGQGEERWEGIQKSSWEHPWGIWTCANRHHGTIPPALGPNRSNVVRENDSDTKRKREPRSPETGIGSGARGGERDSAAAEVLADTGWDFQTFPCCPPNPFNAEALCLYVYLGDRWHGGLLRGIRGYGSGGQMAM